MAAWQAEPWGEFRTELAGGIVAATLANVHRGPDSQPFVPLDFMPYAKASQPSPPPSEEPEPTGADFVREFGG